MALTEPLAPRTLQLRYDEWRGLVINGLASLHTSVTTGSVDLKPDFHSLYRELLDRLKLQVDAWAASSQTAVNPVDDVPEKKPDPTNGAAAKAPVKVKGTRGWPKGKKRGTRKQAEAPQ